MYEKISKSKTRNERRNKKINCLLIIIYYQKTLNGVQCLCCYAGNYINQQSSVLSTNNLYFPNNRTKQMQKHSCTVFTARNLTSICHAINLPPFSLLPSVLLLYFLLIPFHSTSFPRLFVSYKLYFFFLFCKYISHV